MKVLITFNPVAGKGLAREAARSLRDHLEGRPLRDGRAIEAHVLETRLEPFSSWLTPHLEEADLLVILGGDGAVRMLAPAALDARVPIYHYPLGTENLFSRDHGMLADPEHFVATIENGSVVETDVAEIDGALMLLCASSGFDADVVHDLARHRSGADHPSPYVAPVLRTFLRWPRLRSRLSVVIDGGPHRARIRCSGHREFTAVCLASTPLRGFHKDGLLDVVFLPPKRPSSSFWAPGVARHMKHSRVFHARGADLTLQCDPAARIQIDGDAARLGETSISIRARVLPRRLSVLVPTVRESP